MAKPRTPLSGGEILPSPQWSVASARRKCAFASAFCHAVKRSVPCWWPAGVSWLGKNQSIKGAEWPNAMGIRANSLVRSEAGLDVILKADVGSVA